MPGQHPLLNRQLTVRIGVPKLRGCRAGVLPENDGACGYDGGQAEGLVEQHQVG
jgi:hypothetical protein